MFIKNDSNLSMWNTINYTIHNSEKKYLDKQNFHIAYLYFFW